jgi:prepilin peptidase CpaA
MNAQVAIAILVGLAATVDDLARRQISNWIPLAALAGGLGWQIGLHGWLGWLIALGGAAAGFSVFLIFYLLGGMGGGDIKLMAGFGALLGASRLAEAALWTAGVGGLLALGVLALRAVRKRIGKPALPKASAPDSIPDSIPYAPAIALGVWLALVPKG